MKSVVVSFLIAAALSATACSAPAAGEGVGIAEEALLPCSAEDPSLCPLPPFTVVGVWGRRAGTVSEALDLRADGTYSLKESIAPVCVTAPCPTIPTVELKTEGAYAVSGQLIKLRPVRPDPRLPEVFDIVRRLPPIEPLPATDDLSIPRIPVLLHAVERGRDIYLAREITEAPTR